MNGAVTSCAFPRERTWRASAYLARVARIGFPEAVSVRAAHWHSVSKKAILMAGPFERIGMRWTPQRDT